MVHRKGLSKIPGTISKESKTNPMKSKFVQFLLALLCTLPITALAQNDAALPAAPSAASAATTAPDPSAAGTGVKLGTINIEAAIFQSNEGQRDFEALGKKLEPKQTELKNMNDEVESLKKQLNTGSANLTEDARANLVKQIEQKQKLLERSVQDARDDAQNQQQEIASRILQKMAPLIVKFAADKGFGVILDTSNQWPQGPVLWSRPTADVDITKAIVEAYNVQSGVPAPARPVTTKPAATGSTTKPAAPAATKPATGTQPPK